MKATLTVAALVLLPTPCLAALPPHYQRAAEMRAAIDAAAHVLGPADIESVRFLEWDRYEVRAGECVLLVEIVGRQQDADTAGPRQFDAVPGVPVCKGHDLR